MKLKIILMFFIMLVLLIISFLDTAHAEKTIKVSIVGGRNEYFPVIAGQQRTQNKSLDDYWWAVKGTMYRFECKTYSDDKFFTNERNKFLNNDETDVLMLDATTCDMIKCGSPIGGEYIRKQYRNYIEDGGGFIARCGGGSFPLPLDGDPDTGLELVFVEKNSFITNMNTFADIQAGLVPLSEWIGVKRIMGSDNYRPCIRWEKDPTACGTDAYRYYNIDSIWCENTQAEMTGACFNLTDLYRTHAILKDFWGDSLFVRGGGGPSYSISPEEDWVSSLASYPDCFEVNPSQDVYAWSFAPTRNAIDYFKTLLKLAGECILYGVVIEIADLPLEWQDLFEEEQEYTCLPELVDLLSLHWAGWKKTGEIIETKLPNKPAIIAFNYDNNEDNGRVVLSGPHIFMNFWWDDGEIVNHAQEPLHRRDCNGLYHWVDKNGKEINYKQGTSYSNGTFYSTERNETNHSWYLRRETAWASRKVTDDRYLPPVYGRSQVVDIVPSIQSSSEFPIDCCVGGIRAKWAWKEIELSLYYIFMSDPDAPDIGWKKYGTNKYTEFQDEYYFDFDASTVQGDGVYQFCSILKTRNEAGTWTTDDFPPGYDAIVHVKGSISADLSCVTKYPYANTSVLFSSSGSSTAAGTHITNYDWDFGDGSESSDLNPIHTYDDDGVYNITLTVSNNLSYENTTIKTIRIHNNHPETCFEPEYKIVFVNETVNFTDSSTDVDGKIFNWYWDFGDGINSTVKNTSHSYSKSGYYGISLEVTDDDDATNSKRGAILVINSLVNQSMSQQGNIWNKVQDAVDNSTTNDFIYVQNGTYSENIIINNSISLVGEDKNNVVINGSMMMSNPYDYELPKKDAFDLLVVNMTGNELLMRFNNDIDVGENYSTSSLVVDYSGQGNNGTNNGASWTTSTLKGAGAFDFDGINDSINLSSIPAMAGENVTASAWVFWTGGNGTIDPIISQLNATHGYCLYVNNSSMKPCFRLGDDEAISIVTMGSNEWHYIVGTHNQSALKVYVDGVLRGNISKNGFGCDMVGFIGFDNTTNYFDGKIDEVAVWNRTLTDDEIRLIYESNYGIYIQSVTFKDSDVGISPCNHSQLLDCHLVNHTVGVLLNNSSDVRIHMCNISDVDTGIKIIDSNPEIFYFNNLVDCVIDNVKSAIMVNDSSNLYIVRCIVNGSECNLSFSDCDFENISVIYSYSLDNKIPDKPYLSGPSDGDINVSYTFSAITNDSNDDQILYRFDWGDGNNSGWLSLYSSNETVNASHTWMEHGGYEVKVKAKDVFDNESMWSDCILFKTDILPPFINSVNNTPDVIGFGGNITITANVTDDKSGNYTGIQTVKVNISYPNSSTGNFSMQDVGNNTYEYVFSDTWLVGQYNYSIWAMDNAYNTNSSTGHSFNVSGQATVSVCTIKNSYGNNETVNLTDPPSNPPQIGYEFLDDGKVLHIWNSFDSYYFDTDNGVQLTNHYNEHWSHNVLMLGYYNNDKWNLIYRSDNLSGFNRNIESDNETFVNATLWKDLTYKGYDFRLAIRYHLGVDDNELTVIPYIKNIDDEDIPYVLGFAWEINDIRVDMTPSGDYIEINDTKFDLNETLDLTFKNMTDPVYCWDNTTNETIVCDYVPIPFFYIREDMPDGRSESLYLRWNESLNYRVQVKSRDGEYNAPVTLAIRIGALNSGQEKHTMIYWHDASEVVYYFDGYDDMQLGEAWDGDPSFMVDGNISYFARTSVNDDVELCDNNTCSGADLGAISKIEIRCYGYYYYLDSQADIILRPVFSGQDGDDHIYVTSTSGDWSQWFDITKDNNAPGVWNWYDVRDLDCDVEADKDPYGPPFFMLFCSKVEVRVTYTVNYEPVISNPYPADGSTGVSIAPVLNISVYDEDGDLMNISWLSNSSGSWQVFGSNSSVQSGTYHQTMSNASVNGQWWFWMVNVSDGTNYTVSDVFSFFTGYESKINNTGSMDIYGYLLIQVQFWNTTLEEWVLADDTVNETIARRINSSEQFGLDTVFNGKVNTSYLITNFGAGTYQVYAAFRDPDGDVLVCDDESLMEDSYQFTITAD